MNSIPPVHKVIGYLTGNVYIIEDEEELVLVDTGAPFDYALLVDRIKSLGRSPVEIGHILLTHFHADHAGAAAAFRRLSHARVYAHREEAPFLEGKDTVSSIYKLGVLGRLASLVPQTSERFTRVPPVDVDVALEDGQIIPVVGGIKAIHTPGHTPGQTCYFWPEKGILFTGDAIINSYRFFTLPTVGFSCDYSQAADSACRLVDSLEEEDFWLVCAGHGPMVSEYAKEKLLRFRGRLIRRHKR